MNRELLSVESVDLLYRDVQVLRDVGLSVAQRSIVAVIGPNAAGKSSLLNCIAGLLRPESGSITFAGRRIDGLPPERIVRLGLAAVPERSRVFSGMSVIDNLRMGSYIESARAQRPATMEEVFRHFPLLRERIDQKGGTLSGGERRMLAIGRALMSRPKLLMLDEPSLGLAPMLTAKLFDTIREIAAAGLTVLMVEQNVYYSLEIADFAYVLESGRVAMEGPGSELAASEHIRKSYLAI
jgi:branched-chain amino acid transport system ATP-binding protein